MSITDTIDQYILSDLAKGVKFETTNRYDSIVNAIVKNVKERNMWKWLMRMLPKRVITYEGKEYFPQVWFIWWHYLWTDCSEVSERRMLQYGR